jgi:dihydroorotate dehydrogenase
MPDWSYRTLFQPLLFSFSAETGRDLALGAMGRLSRLPFGPTIIDLFGHMRPDARLQTHLQQLPIDSPVGIGHLVDPHGVATAAITRFGIGLIEVGPIAVRELPLLQPMQRRDMNQAIRIPEAPFADSVDDWAERLSRFDRRSVRVLARIVVAANTSVEQAAAECLRLQSRLAPYVDGFVLATADESLRFCWSPDAWRQHVQTIITAIKSANRLACVAIPAELNPHQLHSIVAPAIEAGCRVIQVESRLVDAPDSWLIGHLALKSVILTIDHLRAEFGADVSVIAGGVHEPIDAIELQSHGADCVLVDTGLIYSGPGLPKRINEAVLYASLAKSRELISSASESVRPPLPIQKYTWFWSLVLGAAMLLGAVLAFGIASTRVILPYDEVFVGMSRHELDMINPRLLAFMQHDRVTLSGTMFAIAALYLFLSWYGIRQGMHWAMVAVLTSAFFGFVSFFWFLGFGYFDPFHAFVTTIMFQFLLMAWQGDLGQAQLTSLPNLRETPAWRAAQWGQLLFVIHGAVLVGAGVVISGVGCTDVFVREDLQFMDTCPGDLSLANPRLIPLIAHDRASFGGMLITTGLAVLLTALWGFRQGMRWQWWMLLLAGIPAYILAIGVHWAVGYTSWWHLAPAYGGLTLLVTGLALLWPWLGRVDPVHRDEWNRLLSS